MGAVWSWPLEMQHSLTHSLTHSPTLAVFSFVFCIFSFVYISLQPSFLVFSLYFLLLLFLFLFLFSVWFLVSSFTTQVATSPQYTVTVTVWHRYRNIDKPGDSILGYSAVTSRWSPWWWRQYAPLKRLLQRDYTTLHPRRLSSSYSTPWEPEISHE
jgi:Zn-dependent protease with chaperone function